MRNKISWWRRDEEGTKFQVQFRYFGGNLSWHKQIARFEDWEPHDPTEEDWDQALQDMTDRLHRGLVREELVEKVRKRGRK